MQPCCSRERSNEASHVDPQNDTHAHVEPHWEIGWHDGRPTVWRAGGHGHLRALADAIRVEVGGACIHVDSGDAIHGTGAAQWTSGAAIVPALNAVGVEVMTPGNWEFGFGPALLRDRVAELSFPVIAANARRADTGAPEFAETHIREVGGMRAAFVGITSPIVSRTMPQAFGAGLRFLDALDVLPELIATLRETERPDLVVLVSHYGFAQEVAIARAVHGIDVILGGHTHDLLVRPVMVGRTIVTQSGAHGSYLTRLDLEVEHGRVVDVRHRLIPVAAGGATDPAVDEVVRESLRPHRAALDEVVGETRTLLHRGTVLEAPMDTVITDAYRASTGADVALSHPIRFAGMRVVARVNNPAGSRLQQVEIGGAPLDPARAYSVAAAGEQSVRGGDLIMSGVRAIDSVRHYLAAHTPHKELDVADAFVAI